MTWNAARNAQKDDARATVWRKVRYFDGPGHHWGLDWVIFKSFWEPFWYQKSQNSTRTFQFLMRALVCTYDFRIKLLSFITQRGIH